MKLSVTKKKVERVQRLLGFEGMLAVDCQEQGGGVVMLWKHQNEVKLNSFSLNHIDVVYFVHGWRSFRLVGFYVKPNRSQIRVTWDLIRHLSRDNNLPWCLIDDLNNVPRQSDKRGGRQYMLWLIQGFQSVLEDCDSKDMDMFGHPYTWERGRGTSNWMEVLLDRALISSDWAQIFQDARLTNLEVSTSDHCPILLEPKVENITRGVKMFRFENAWLREPMCQKIIEESWVEDESASLQHKLKSCSKRLMNWGKEITGNLEKE